MEYEVKMLDLESGVCPFEDWFESVHDNRTNARIRARIIRIRAGNFGDTKPVGEGVSELRLDFGPGYRVYYGSFGRTIVVLVAGGDKSTQSRDISQAKQLWGEHKDAPERFQRDF